MSRGGSSADRTAPIPGNGKQIGLGWVDYIYDQFIINRWMVGTPSLFSLATIASVKINSYDEKGKLVRRVTERLTQYTSQADLNPINNHLNGIVQAYTSLHFPVIDLEATLTYRALVGASSSFGQPAFEVGLSFDPILNVPCIPGSSIKGAVKASAALKEVFSDELVKELFGNGSIGRLDFSDAYPVKVGVKGYLIIPDVLTPHYNKGEEDILQEHKVMPTPIPFLSIAPGTVFRFIVADRKQDVDQSFVERFLKAVAVTFTLGVGAKTAIGYGSLELVRASFEKSGYDA
jgi:CRISPR-associated protein Cmr6